MASAVGSSVLANMEMEVRKQTADSEVGPGEETDTIEDNLVLSRAAMDALVRNLSADRLTERELAMRSIENALLFDLRLLEAGATSQDAELADRCRRLLSSRTGVVRTRLELLFEQTIVKGAGVSVALAIQVLEQMDAGAKTAVDRDYLIQLAGNALVAGAKPGDGATLRRVVAESESTHAKAYSLEALGAIGSNLANLEVRSTEHAQVRLGMARALVWQRDASCARRLVALLGEQDDGVRAGAVELLRALTGRQFGFDPLSDPSVQQDAATQWRRYVEASEFKVARWAKPVFRPWEIAMVGGSHSGWQDSRKFHETCLFVVEDKPRLRWCKRIVDGLRNERYTKSYCTMTDQGALLLPGDAPQKIIEVSRSGEPTVEHTLPIDVDVESVRRDRRGRFYYAHSGGIGVATLGKPPMTLVDAKTLEFSPTDLGQTLAGGLLVIGETDSDDRTVHVAEISHLGSVVRRRQVKFRDSDGGARLHLMPGGGYAIVRTMGEAIEFDMAGKVVRRWGDLYQHHDKVCAVIRLPNGRTALALGWGWLVICSPDGRVIWEKQQSYVDRRGMIIAAGFRGGVAWEGLW